MQMTAQALADANRGEVRGDPQVVVEGAQTIHRAGPSDVAFAADEKNLKKLARSRAGVAFVPRALAAALGDEHASRTLILVDDPQAAFLRVLERFRPPRPRANIGISPQSFISPTAKIGKHTNIHPGAFVGDGAVVGDHCDVFPGVCIGRGCTLGHHVTLYPNVVLYADVKIGNRVWIHAGAVIGADGFGYRLVDGRHQKLPHYGNVEIGDDVEIGACSTVDRAMIGTTVIGEGTKIDNLVMIAHNCELGRHNLLVSQVGFAGSVTTGDYVVCAGQVGVADHVHLGERSVYGAKAGVHKDMPGGQTYLGAPATPESEAIRVVMSQQKLPEMRKQLRQLEAQVAELTRALERLSNERPAPPSASNSAA